MLYHINYNGFVWTIEDLTSGVISVDSNSGAAGFGLGGTQHVFFMGTGF